MTDPNTGREEDGAQASSSLRSDDEPISIPDEWMEMLVAIMNRLDYDQAVQAWTEADAFQSHIMDHWQAEAEAHMERLAEDGRYYR